MKRRTGAVQKVHVLKCFNLYYLYLYCKDAFKSFMSQIAC